MLILKRFLEVVNARKKYSNIFYSCKLTFDNDNLQNICIFVNTDIHFRNIIVYLHLQFHLAIR